MASSTRRSNASAPSATWTRRAATSAVWCRKSETSTTIQVAIPADLYAQVAARAAAHGQTADEALIDLAKSYIVATPKTTPATLDVYEAVEGYDPATDPLAEFAGIAASGDPDWIDHHDRHLAELEYPEAPSNGKR